MKKILITLACLAGGMSTSYAGDTARVLFIGNSYTSVNNLPQTVATVAASAGDAVIWDVNAPGGTTLQMHSTDATTLSKIAAGNWDYVVLQEQSQTPAFPDGQVETDMYPYAKKLDSLVRAASPCAETIFYMTWGRKNGDADNCAFFPPLCTYSGMDSLIRLRYQIMADTNQAILSPVGAVWHRLRGLNPGIELYQADESHPSIAGTYAAACAFYAAIFAKDPMTITSTSGVPATDAAAIRVAAKAVVFDSLLYWKIGAYTPPVWCGGTTGTDYIAQDKSIRVAVADGSVSLTSSEAIKAGTVITVTGMDGRTIARKYIDVATQQVNMETQNIAAGVYVVTITDGRTRIAKKIIISQ